MATQFISMMVGLDVPEKFQELMKKQGINDAEAFALLATDEKEVKSEIFAMARSGDAELVEVVEQIAVKKLWFACPKRLLGQQSSSSSVPGDALPKETNIDLKAH